ncbi:M81 family metallopeptidase [Pokkaliibacter sp. MBI-7]|uniref:M81 family metallopeptidase n=1 Tax=Pokkaliibacter sp. MBI-7 TaxID=3040600 RepID=UPI00244D3365|nr:M81 family metallopeptidase [Pokkaliibacter sp. MBI-7]MDH2435032.1 M81 family metallopeptidase [Pokkaliibacter sp. MBI-7]
MNVFVASLATETNTFSPVYTDIHSFRESFYAAPGEHPDTPTLCSAPFIACRELIRAEGWSLVEGTATWAEPGGLVNRQTYEQLRDEILAQLRAAMPVQGVILGLHGAMVADGYLDCEGDLLERVRAIVGPDVTIAAEFDPHSHLTEKRFNNCDLMVAFKEFPHVDFLDRAYDLVRLAVRHMKGEIIPTKAMFDCRMIEVLPTSREPMRSFVDRLQQLEQQPGVLTISVIHGFMAGDVPEMGTRVLVITDNDPARATQLADTLGMELYSFRGTTRPPYLAPVDAVQEVISSPHQPVVLADVWDNPGGGVAGDATLLLRALLDAGVNDAAVGTIWDPMAVRFCLAAGEGAVIKLRFGGKSCDNGGAPVDAWVEIKRTVREAVQDFGESVVPMGDAVWIRLQGTEMDIILNSNRAQAFSPTLFSNMGIDPLSKPILLIKSTNHFYDAFSRISQHIVYCDAGAPYPSNPKTNDYRHLSRPIWPIVEHPHAAASTVISEVST